MGDFDIEAMGMYASEAVTAGLVAEGSLKLDLHIQTDLDFTTEIFKSDCAFTFIPEIGLEIPDGLSKFKTVKDFLINIESDLKNAPDMPGLESFLSDLNDCVSGKRSFHLIIEDALGLSHMQPPPTRLSQLVVTRTERKSSDEIYFGLNRKSSHQMGSDPIQTLCDWVQESNKIVILSGAGISTESGIPAFRSPDGMDNLWDKYDPGLATINSFKQHDHARAEYWNMHSELYELVGRGVKPNAAHGLAIKLVQKGKLLKVITQNIDGLYQAAGLDPKLLLELHGTVTTSRCSVCSNPHDRNKTHEIWKSGVAVPACEECNGPLRFGTVAFGESLPPGSIEASQQYIRECDLLIIMGTSLVVQPANKLPEVALDLHIPVALLNLGPTPLDHVVDLHITSACGVIAEKVIQSLDELHNVNSVRQGSELFGFPAEYGTWLRDGDVEGLSWLGYQLYLQSLPKS